MKTRYKFLRQLGRAIRSNSGSETWKIGEWKKIDGQIKLCQRGFHCSKEIYQAFSYVQGEILAKVEVKGKSDIQDDKEAYSEMRIVKAWKWTKMDSVAFSIYAAELVLHNYEKEYPNDLRPREAIKAAKKWLKTGSKKDLSAAKSAAWSAARSAAWSAARSATWSAAWSAAESAESAWSATESAESAARSAAWSAARSAAWSAAWSAAESAESAWSAAESAESAAESAKSAAKSAERSATWSAESATVKKISKWMDKHLKEMEEIV